MVNQVTNETGRAIPLYGKVVLSAGSSIKVDTDLIRPETRRLLKIEDVSAKVNPRSMQKPTKPSPSPTTPPQEVFQAVVTASEAKRKKKR